MTSFTLASLASFVALFTHVAADGGPLPQLNGLFTSLAGWLKNIIAVGGGLFLMIDMAKHVFSSPRDLKAVGIDLVVFAVLMVVVLQADAIVAWAMAQAK